MLEKLNLSDIRSFVLVAQLGNLTKAADALHVSRSHISRQLTNLEKMLGVTLITRTTRTLTLTETGENLLTECEKALNLINHATQEAVNAQHKMTGLIRINSVGGYLGESCVAPLVAEFLMLYPDIQIELDFSSQKVDMLANHFDVVFRMGKLDDERFIARKLKNIHTLTLAHPNYLAKYGTPTHPEMLTKHRCIVGSVTQWHYQQPTKQPSEIISVTPPATLKCKNGHAMVHTALMGLGIIRVPIDYCENEIKQQNLIPILQDWEMSSIDFSLLYQQDKFRPEKIQTFITFAKKWFNTHTR